VGDHWRIPAVECSLFFLFYFFFLPILHTLHFPIDCVVLAWMCVHNGNIAKAQVRRIRRAMIQVVVFANVIGVVGDQYRIARKYFSTEDA
jgi:hypothetical protein